MDVLVEEAHFVKLTDAGFSNSVVYLHFVNLTSRALPLLESLLLCSLQLKAYSRREVLRITRRQSWFTKPRLRKEMIHMLRVWNSIQQNSIVDLGWASVGSRDAQMKSSWVCGWGKGLIIAFRFVESQPRGLSGAWEGMFNFTYRGQERLQGRGGASVECWRMKRGLLGRHRRGSYSLGLNTCNLEAKCMYPFLVLSLLAL